MGPTPKVHVAQAQPYPSTDPSQLRNNPANKVGANNLAKSGNSTTDIPQSPEPATPNAVPSHIPTRSRPTSCGSNVEENPIKEANVVDRNSMVTPVVDDEEEPILEANVAEQAKEIRRSMQNLHVDDSAMEEVGEQAHMYQDGDASEPLL